MQLHVCKSVADSYILDACSCMYASELEYSYIMRQIRSLPITPGQIYHQLTCSASDKEMFWFLQGIDESNEEAMGELLTDSTAKLTSAVR